ncbi:MAG: site-specific DNA-methyltransferase [Chloroflexi bacterium]|nr:site-specific DNA-methyltransferase [Chloroflexota bacterium]
MTSTPAPDVARLHTLHEHLRQLALADPTPDAADTLMRLRQELSTRERLAALLQGALDFHGEDSSYASHDLHAFAAKFPPQLPRAFIRGLTQPGDVVLDPMMGSGTALVEALLEGRHAIGLDIDPLALRLGQVKTARWEVAPLREAGHRALARAGALLASDAAVEQALAQRFDQRTRAFLDYWFFPSTQRELMALLLAIEESDNVPCRHFLELTFSSIIVTKSGGVARARDLAHSRPHRVETKIPRNALEQFSLRLRKNLTSIAQFQARSATGAILAGDARRLPLQDSSIHLIVTSPPYANAIDYMRAHKFSLVWLGASMTTLSELRAAYLGSERTQKTHQAALPDGPEEIIAHLAACDAKKAAILRKYFVEMKVVLDEMYRVLRHDAPAVVVVGTSTMRGIDVQTHSCLADIATYVGFDVVGVAQRRLDRNKRMMPARFGKQTDSIIEQRMHEEYVIGLLKPDCEGGTSYARSQ